MELLDSTWSDFINTARDNQIFVTDPPVLRIGQNPGGKYFLIKELYPRFPAHLYYFEPFGGTYQVVLNKEPSKFEFVNDLDKEITDLAIGYLLMPDAIIDAIRLDLNSQGLLECLLSVENGSFDYRVIRTLYLMYHTPPTGDNFAYSLNTDRKYSIKQTKASVMKIRDRMSRIHIFSEDFRVFLRRAMRLDHVLIYLDPPFTESDTDNIYDHNFKWSDHLDLFRILSNFDPERVKWFLSYGKDSRIERLYSEYNIEDVEIRSTFAFSTDNDYKTRKELMITNYDTKSVTKTLVTRGLLPFLKLHGGSPNG